MYDPAIGRWNVQDSLAKKYYLYSQYNFVLNNPLLFIDPNGEDVYYVFYDQSNKEYKAAAETRRDEIMNAEDYNSKSDQVVMISYGEIENMDLDLAGFKSSKTSELEEAGFGKTAEVGFYGHAGLDGPNIGEKLTGDYDLSKVTGSPTEKGQVSQEGWENIAFNWKENGSALSEYGCKSEGFAIAASEFSNGPTYVTGADGDVGGSKRSDKFRANLFTGRKKKIYLKSALGFPNTVYRKGRKKKGSRKCGG